jgi:hypothetical protein
MKKLVVYKVMSNNLFITYSYSGIRLAYKVLGKRIVNTLVNRTAGEIFTSGETIPSLIQDMAVLEKKKVGSVGNYVAEGLESMESPHLDITVDCILDSIRALTKGGEDGNLAIKFTALLTLDILTKLSTAQRTFV